MIAVLPLPAFSDNYIWVIRDEASGHVAVVDPGDASVVEDYLERSGARLYAILLTHHHADHTGGVEALRARHAVPVYGPYDTRMPMVTHALKDGEQLDLPGLSLSLRVLAVPGHTREHIALFAAEAPTQDRRPLLFCGDTLFAAGCGRMFEGTALQMHASLQRLADLPPDTLVYCTHEYTLSNLAFARHVLPRNAAIANRERSEAAKRELGQPTLPSSIALEQDTNPFLRSSDPQLLVSLHGRLSDSSPAGVFGALRRWKDEFR